MLILVGVLMLLARRRISLGTRLKHAVAYGMLSSVPLTIVLARNWAVSGGLTGYKPTASS